MTNACTICQNKISLPYNLITCGHAFCFLCIKTFVLDGHTKCPTCETFIDDNLNNVVIDNISDKKLVIDDDTLEIIFWVYSSAFNNVWWCYDDLTNEHIELIYQDYVKRQNMESDDENNEFDVILDKNIKHNEGNIINYDQFAQIMPKYTDKSSTLSGLQDHSFDMVSFSSCDEKDSNDLDSNIKQSVLLSYIIDVGRSKYKIDFDAMKQINIVDSNKQRRIKRIEIHEKPENINMEDLHNYLYQNYNIIGIAGIKFIK